MERPWRPRPCGQWALTCPQPRAPPLWGVQAKHGITLDPGHKLPLVPRPCCPLPGPFWVTLCRLNFILNLQARQEPLGNT